MRVLQGSTLFLGGKFACGLALVLLVAGCGRSGDERAEAADTQSVLAQVLFNQRQYAKSLDEIRRAIQANSELKRDSALGENHLVEAHCQRQLGEYEEAKGAFKRALQAFNITGDQKLERRGRVAMAELYFELQEIPNALSLASDAATEARIFSDTVNLSHALALIANVHHRQKQFDEEIKVRSELLALSPGVGGSRISEELQALILAYAEAGRPDHSAATFRRLMSYEASLHDSAGLARAYYAWGRYQARLGCADSALNSFTQALAMLSRRSTRRLQTDVLIALGNLSYHALRYDDARRYYGDAQRLAKEENNILQEPLLSAMLIVCDWKLSGQRAATNQLPELIRRCSRLKTSCSQTGFVSAEAFITFVKGRLEQQLPSAEESMKSYAEAITLSHKITLPTAEDDPAFGMIELFMRGEKTGWFNPLLNIYASSGDVAKAFELSERKKLIEVSWFFTGLSISTREGRVDEPIRALRVKRKTLELLQRDILEEFAAGRQRSMERIESLGTLFRAGMAEIETGTSALQGNAFSMAH